MFREEEILLGILKDTFEDLGIENITFDSISNFSNLNEIYDKIFESRFLSCSHDIVDVFKCLCSYYLLNGNNINTYTYNFIINNNYKDIYELFYTSSSFGCDLLKNFYICNLFHRGIINLNENEFKEYDITEKCYIATDFVRCCVENVFDKLTRKGLCGEEIVDILVKTLNGNKICDDIDINNIYELRNVFKRIIISDVYEDICMSQNEYAGTDEIDLPDQIIYDSVEKNKDILNHNFEVDNYAVGYFIDLLYNPLRRKNNRSCLSQDQVKKLAKVNPFYKYERASL